MHMTFPELLNTYIHQLHCTAGELADASGLTQASLSRYRNGQRIPETDTLKKLAAGIVHIAEQNSDTGLDFDFVFFRLYCYLLVDLTLYHKWQRC